MKTLIRSKRKRQPKLSINGMVRRRCPTCLLERDIKSLDLYTDFSEEDGQVEGVTEFRLGQKPVVKIAARLTETANLENRFRTTLTNEYGHVQFRNFLYQVEEKSTSLLENLHAQAAPMQQVNHCNRDSMVSLDDRDWMEWQAGFVCGAMLVPITPLLELVRASRQKVCMVHASIPSQSREGLQIIAEVAQSFQTSKYAARVRPLQKKILSSDTTQSLPKYTNIQISRSSCYCCPEIVPVMARSFQNWRPYI